LVIILLILAGFGWLITQNTTIIYVLGGLVFAYMGLNMIRSQGVSLDMEESRMDSSLLGGLFYTAFNPTQPPWWATAGLALLLKGVEVMGITGAVMVTMGHWLSDFAYYILISYMVHRQGRFTNPHHREISIILGAFITLLAIYFISQGLRVIL
jgi:threonine/homoserine/homoserine lactone efflux protein